MGPVLAGLKDVTGSSKTILVVDDETPLRQLIGRFLADSGWVVLDAANADEALRLVERYSDQEAIDLLVTDVVMPGGTDGFVLAAEVARIRPSIKVLYMSGHFEDRQAVRQGLREAGRYFIRKPFSRDDFLRTITSALETPVQASDAFAVILGHPGIEARAITDTRPPDGPKRSLRYRVRLPIRYRFIGASVWEGGVTRDISRSGLFFDASSPIEVASSEDARPAVEVRLELPESKHGSVEVTGRGHVARTALCDAFAMPTAMAVSVTNYHTDVRAH